jgi:hypothetical protein
MRRVMQWNGIITIIAVSIAICVIAARRPDVSRERRSGADRRSEAMHTGAGENSGLSRVCASSGETPVEISSAGPRQCQAAPDGRASRTAERARARQVEDGGIALHPFDSRPGRDPYEGCDILEEKSTDSGEMTRRRRIVRTDGKYPLVYVEDLVRVDPDDGTENVHVQKEMVADHIVVKLQEGATEADLAALNARHGGEVRRKLRVPGPGTYLIAFRALNLDTVIRAVETYAAEADAVCHAGPDHIVRHCVIPNDPDFYELWGMNNEGQFGGAGRMFLNATNQTLPAGSMRFAGLTSEEGVTGELVHCGKGYPSQIPSAVNGNIALIERGDLAFAEKTANAMDKGARAVIIYNNT